MFCDSSEKILPLKLIASYIVFLPLGFHLSDKSRSLDMLDIWFHDFAKIFISAYRKFEGLNSWFNIIHKIRNPTFFFHLFCKFKITYDTMISNPLLMHFLFKNLYECNINCFMPSIKYFMHIQDNLKWSDTVHDMKITIYNRKVGYMWIKEEVKKTNKRYFHESIYHWPSKICH